MAVLEAPKPYVLLATVMIMAFKTVEMLNEVLHQNSLSFKGSRADGWQPMSTPYCLLSPETGTPRRHQEKRTQAGILSREDLRQNHCSSRP